MQIARKNGAQSSVYAHIREKLQIEYQQVCVEMAHVEKRISELEDLRREVAAIEKLRIVVERRQTQFKQRYDTVLIENQNL